jgi:hypothetical protein
MITEERLQEMEYAPREAYIAKLEMRELAHAYRLALRALANTFPPCKGKNCGVTDGFSHSIQCIVEHNAAIDAARGKT